MGFLFARWRFRCCYDRRSLACVVACPGAAGTLDGVARVEALPRRGGGRRSDGASRVRGVWRRGDGKDSARPVFWFLSLQASTHLTFFFPSSIHTGTQSVQDAQEAQSQRPQQARQRARTRESPAKAFPGTGKCRSRAWRASGSHALSERDFLGFVGWISAKREVFGDGSGGKGCLCVSCAADVARLSRSKGQQRPLFTRSTRHADHLRSWSVVPRMSWVPGADDLSLHSPRNLSHERGEMVFGGRGTFCGVRACERRLISPLARGDSSALSPQATRNAPNNHVHTGC
jgi:hypothetical protein